MRRTYYRPWLLAVLASVCVVGAANSMTAPRSKKPHATPGFPSTFVSACRVTGHVRELRYASDLNSLSGVAAKGAIIAYAIDIGEDGPPSDNSSDGKTYYESFNLFVVNAIKPGDLPNGMSRPDLGKSVKTDPATIFYRALDGTLWSIEWRASVTFDDDAGSGGLLEGQGGLLSNAEYDDIVRYLQTQPFQLVSDWKSLFGHARRLPVCQIKWTKTDGYLQQMNQGWRQER